MSPMPPPPPPPGIAGAAFSGLSAMTTSVVRNSAAIDAAFCSAERVTLAGSMMPALTMSTYSPVAASRPCPASRLRTLSTTTPPSRPAFTAICLSGDSSASRTMFAPVASSPMSSSFSNAVIEACSRATPPPATMPSSTAAFALETASSIRCFFSLSSTSVAAPTLMTATEVELKEKKHRIEDAVSNAKAAVEEGIVAGGGVALLPASITAFEKLELIGDEATGANIVRLALESPLKQIAVNAGLEGGVVVERVRNLEAGHGLDAATGEYVDMVKAGIIDPAKVTRSALQNAASIAALFLTTEVVIADKPEKAAPAMPGGGGGGMGDMDF